jgi:Protein of unknown function (DUF1573)
MKNLLILLVVTGFVACQTSDKKTTGETTTIQWLDSTTLDLGSIKEGQILEVQYHFKNTGDKNLVIEDVSASCGCTVAEKPEKPIAPGKEDVIKAKFDSRSKSGPQFKTLMVTANTTPEKVHNLSFKVQVTE